MSPGPARLPEGARDILPTERSEVAALEGQLRACFGAFGYREVRTPLIEFADEMDRAQDGGVSRAFRLFDRQDRVLVLRPDLTIPVARLMATRLADRPAPIRVSYVGARLRPAREGTAEPIEEQQAGAELVGVSGPAADAEIMALLVRALNDVGIDDAHVAVGHVGLMRAVLSAVGVDDDAQARLQGAARSRDIAGWREIANTLALSDEDRRRVAELPTRRGGVDVLDRLAQELPAVAQECAEVSAALESLGGYGIRGRVSVDLGVLRDWGYYSGVVFEVAAPGVPRPIAAGGRYDALGVRFGADRPAVGGGIWLDGLHRAVNARRREPSLREGVVLIGGMDEHIALAMKLRDRGIPVAAVSDAADAEAVAEVDGWRYVATARASGDVVLTDRSTGQRVESSDVLEVLRSRNS